MQVPAGTRIVYTQWYDNSTQNKANPDANREVTVGRADLGRDDLRRDRYRNVTEDAKSQPQKGPSQEELFTERQARAIAAPPRPPLQEGRFPQARHQERIQARGVTLRITLLALLALRAASASIARPLLCPRLLPSGLNGAQELAVDVAHPRRRFESRSELDERRLAPR